MTVLYPCPPARLYFHDGNGHPLAGGTLSTYINNSTTPIQTYRDGLGMVKNPATITLDDRGEARVFLDPRIAYRLVVRDAFGAVVLEQDGIRIPDGSGGGGGTVAVNVKSDDGSVTVKSSLDGDVMVFDVSVDSFVKTEIEKETTAREEADKSLSDDIGVVSNGLSTETDERKAADEELAKAIGGKQGTLKDGDNIHIDDALKVNVVNRKTLQVKSPLTAERLDTALVIGIRDGVFASAEELEAETAARKTGDEQNRQRIDKVDADLNAEIQNRIEAVSKKQDSAYLFNSNTSTLDEVNAVIDKGMDIYSASGSNVVQWQGSIHGGYPTLTRVEDGWQYSWHYSDGKWTQTTRKLAGVPTAGRLTVGLNGTATLSYYDWTFVFQLNSMNAAVVNVKNPNVAAADYFTETRTYGNNKREAGVDFSNGYDIAYAGNGDFQSVPARIVMDIFTGTEWLELRLMQYTSGSSLVIDYRIGGSNG